MRCLPLVVKDENHLCTRWGECVCVCGGVGYLLKEGELLGNVVSTVFILAKGEMLLVC